ncbi:MAG: response regulator transcription factor [Melioribacteraceae bacterium]|jgi:DNA-binding NarL/FixJ family response regulator|nr:response regulator transcription factor [Melioribacteraceae bacterium]
MFNSTKIKVFLADDHNLIRAGIKSLISELSGIEVIGEAEDGREAIDKIIELKPDIVLLDIKMKELNGLEVTARLNKEYPDVLIIILSMHSNEEYVVQALKAGASGYLLKDSLPSELEIAIKSVMKGKTYLSPTVSQKLVTDYLKRVSDTDADTEKDLGVFDLLTARQREVLQLIAEGNSTKEIADKLHVSIKTIETHRAQIMERLQIFNLQGLVKYAIKTGLISSE